MLSIASELPPLPRLSQASTIVKCTMRSPFGRHMVRFTAESCHGPGFIVVQEFRILNAAKASLLGSWELHAVPTQAGAGRVSLAQPVLAAIITVYAVVGSGTDGAFLAVSSFLQRPGEMVNTTTTSNRRFADPANAANFTDAAVPAGAAATFEEACTKPYPEETCEYDTSGPVVQAPFVKPEALRLNGYGPRER